MPIRMVLKVYAAVAFVATLVPAQAQIPPATIATTQAIIQPYPKQIRSLSCRITTTTIIGSTFLQNNNIPEGAVAPVQVEEGELAFKDNKVINKSHHTEGDPAPTGHGMAEVNLFDGDNGYSIRSENGGLASRSIYASRQHQANAGGYWSPLEFGYKLNGQWWSDILGSANPTIERAGIDPNYGQLYLMHLNIGKREEHVWFAPQYGNVAVKIVEGNLDNGATFTGSHYKRYGGLWMPLQGEFRMFMKQPNGQTITQVDKKFVFSDIQVNSVPDTAFDFKWPTGAALYDNDTRTKYWRDVSGKWVARTDLGKAEAHTYDHLSAADVVPWVLLICLAALSTLGFIRWRRSASA